jgi:1-acyl-sn-glycerol-3-phosphate acyltransferase
MNKIISGFKEHVWYQWLVSLTAAVYFFWAGLMLSIISVFVKPFMNEQQAHRAARYSMHYVNRIFFYGLQLSGLVHVDFKDLEKLYNERGIIITPNPAWLMDALFITAILPNVVCVMKSSVISNPVFFGVASLGGFISSDSASQFIQQCQKVLDDGAQLLLFPEGTRTVTKSVNTFKGGFALIAKKTGAPIQTVFIEVNTPFLGKRWPFWKKPPFPLDYRCILGERFQVKNDQDHKAFTKELENYFKNRFS